MLFVEKTFEVGTYFSAQGGKHRDIEQRGAVAEQSSESEKYIPRYKKKTEKSNLHGGAAFRQRGEVYGQVMGFIHRKGNLQHVAWETTFQKCLEK